MDLGQWVLRQKDSQKSPQDLVDSNLKSDLTCKEDTNLHSWQDD